MLCNVHIGTPEDTHFYYDHLAKGGKLHRINQPLIEYRYVNTGISNTVVKAKTLWDIRIHHFQTQILENPAKWSGKSFSIWGSGKFGKLFFRSLKREHQDRVSAMGDVDAKKIGSIYHERESRITLNIVHFSELVKPIVICVKAGTTGGNLERNVASLGLEEGMDFFFFA